MAGPLTTQPLPAIHDCDVHVHEREADLNAAGATNHLDGAREVLQCLEQLIEWFTFGPVRGSVDFHDCIDIETVIVVTRSEEHTSELQSLMRISYAVFCLKKKKIHRSP